MFDILEIIKSSPSPLTARAVARKMHAGKGETAIYKKMLDKLVKEGKLQKKKEHYSIPDKSRIIEGTVLSTASGADYLSSPKLEGDIKIVHSRDFAVMHNDTVQAKLKGDKCEIVRIVSRNTEKTVGTVIKDGATVYVKPDDRKIHEVFILPKTERKNAAPGDKVVAYITSYPTGCADGVCRIEENLGSCDDDYTAVLSVLRSYNIEESFPDEVTREAEAVPCAVTNEDIAGRLDLRKLTVISIDGESARDLDDAVSLEICDDGSYLLGVHIADVAHYVFYRSAIDREAEKRATSVYTPHKVFPMLPQKLSNGVCSLNQGEDRLTLSCFMKISRNGKITEYNIAPSVIKSKHRLTYTEVTDCLENTKSPYRKKYSDIFGMLVLMKELALLLEGVADKRGAIDFDIPEAEIRLDETGFPIEIKPEATGLSNRIIEQFMLAANRTVADFMLNAELPCVYRVHQHPDEKKLESFRELIKIFDKSLPLTPSPKDFNRLLGDFIGTPQEALIKKTMLRTMSKAKYSSSCDGHFGLAMDEYLHFTSPIRRYPDLIVHRVLHRYFDNEASQIASYGKRMEHLAELCTQQEINAAQAERDIDDICCAQYMSKRIGDIYDAVISGVTAYGIFAELENTVEGFIPISTIDGCFEYDDTRFCLESDSMRFTLGDTIKIRVHSVSIPLGKIEFSLVTPKGK